MVTETGFPHIWPLNGGKGEKSGRPGYGKADCDSGPCAALLPFPFGMVDWESAPRRLRTVGPLVGAIAPLNNSNDTVSQITRSSFAYPYEPPAPIRIVNQKLTAV